MLASPSCAVIFDILDTYLIVVTAIMILVEAVVDRLTGPLAAKLFLAKLIDRLGRTQSHDSYLTLSSL